MEPMISHLLPVHCSTVYSVQNLCSQCNFRYIHATTRMTAFLQWAGGSFDAAGSICRRRTPPFSGSAESGFLVTAWLWCWSGRKVSTPDLMMAVEGDSASVKVARTTIDEGKSIAFVFPCSGPFRSVSARIEPAESSGIQAGPPTSSGRTVLRGNCRFGLFKFLKQRGQHLYLLGFPIRHE